MKIIRIIDGRRYNTETATRVADVGSNGGYSCNDFHYHDTAIFRTTKGAWFIAGEGGAMSRWARPHGQNGWSGGSGIVPLTDKDALEELEAARATDAIEQYFGAQVEDA